MMGWISVSVCGIVLVFAIMEIDKMEEKDRAGGLLFFIHSPTDIFR